MQGRARCLSTHTHTNCATNGNCSQETPSKIVVLHCCSDYYYCYLVFLCWVILFCLWIFSTITFVLVGFVFGTVTHSYTHTHTQRIIRQRMHKIKTRDNWFIHQRRPSTPTPTPTHRLTSKTIYECEMKQPRNCWCSFMTSLLQMRKREEEDRSIIKSFFSCASFFPEKVRQVHFEHVHRIALNCNVQTYDFSYVISFIVFLSVSQFFIVI